MYRIIKLFIPIFCFIGGLPKPRNCVISLLGPRQASLSTLLLSLVFGLNPLNFTSYVVSQRNCHPCQA